MVYRSSRHREAKRIRQLSISTLADKLRRHRNKYRIWRRALKRLGLAPIPVEITN